MAQKEKKLAAVHPNAGIEAAFRKKLEHMIDEMNSSVEYWLSAAYKANTPEMAQDKSPAVMLKQVMRRLSKKWNQKFADLAPEISKYFATAAKDRIDGSFQNALKEAGFTVRFTTTRAINDIIQATVAENVSLIKTISSEYLSDVEQMVMRSVTQGRDLGGLRKELEDRYGITKRRATLIAKQSNNNVSAMVKRAREEELGITEAVWIHARKSRHPRHEHEEWNGKRYNIKTGMYSKVSGKYVWPGTDFSCGCIGRSILPSMNRTAYTE